MGLVLQNAYLLHLDPAGFEAGGVRVEGESIAELGASATAKAGDEVIDCRGAVVLAGLVNGHTHLYSALAVGMPAPPRAPRNFHEILELIWWRLDRALDKASIETSGLIGALDALHCGTTTLIDHHASPNCIAGSLDHLERGIARAGLRAVLCYETTDRNGAGGSAAGLAENRRYLEECGKRPDGTFAGMVGAHAAFTMSDETLRACARLAEEQRVGIHIHAAEDPCDERICREKYGAGLVERLDRCGVLTDRTIVAHGTHFSVGDASRISGTVAAIAHNPRSNMNNQVGYAPVGSFRRTQLGTDGIGSDLFTEARHAWFKARDARIPLSPESILAMLVQSARTASTALNRTVGKLASGAAADIVCTDYFPASPADATNAAGHFLFGLGAQHVKDVLIAGQWVMRDRSILGFDEIDARRAAEPISRGLWKRMADL